MKTGTLPHIVLFLITVAFIALSSLAVSKMPKKWQNSMFIVAAALCSGGIFFRYAMNCSFTDGIKLGTLLIQMLQVCNFNFVLLPLMLIPRCNIARQYSVFFSMFAAATTLFSFPKSMAVYEWYDPLVLNFWFNHVFAIALPLWMMAAGRLRPDRKYIPWVSASVFGYFTLVYIMTEALMAWGILPPGSSFSYVHDPKGMPIITQLYELIETPYIHLLPLFFVLIAVFYLWAMPFNRSVTFIASNGSVRKKIYGLIGSEVDAPQKKFADSGLTLIGWSTEASSRDIQYSPGARIVISRQSTVLYAVFQDEDGE